MADQGVWFKLWCSVLMDPALSNLEMEDFGRWAKLGALIKQQGTAGTLTIQSPAVHLCSAFQVASFDAMLTSLHGLPGVCVETHIGDVTGVTTVTVTMLKWAKYQGDNSQPRVARYRERVTAKKRGEENKRSSTASPPTPSRPNQEDRFREWKAKRHPERAKADATPVDLAAELTATLERVKGKFTATPTPDQPEPPF